MTAADNNQSPGFYTTKYFDKVPIHRDQINFPPVPKEPHPILGRPLLEEEELDPSLLKARIGYMVLEYRHGDGDSGLLPEDAITSVKVFRQGNFTAALINNKHLGIAKRNPTDRWNPETGLQHAINKGLRNMLEIS